MQKRKEFNRKPPYLAWWYSWLSKSIILFFFFVRWRHKERCRWNYLGRNDREMFIRWRLTASGYSMQEAVIVRKWSNAPSRETECKTPRVTNTPEWSPSWCGMIIHMDSYSQPPNPRNLGAAIDKWYFELHTDVQSCQWNKLASRSTTALIQIVKLHIYKTARSLTTRTREWCKKSVEGIKEFSGKSNCSASEP